MSTITIQGKILGQRKPLLPDWALPLPPAWQEAGHHVLLREFITRVVLDQVAAFRQRQAERQLLHILTPAEIAQEAARGKVTLGGSDLDQKVDPQAAVETALLAFQDGLYMVFVDGERQSTLDDALQIRPDSQVTFVRLVPLAGG